MTTAMMKAIAGQEGRVLEPVQHLRGDRPVEPVRLAEVAANGVEDPLAVLNVERLIQPELVTGLAQQLFGAAGTEDRLGRIARGKVHHREDDDRNPEQDRDHPEQPPRQDECHDL